jgi:HPt (histidine-containing phosphotransfer) domain-containing protein
MITNIDGINVADGLKRFANNEKLYTKSLLRFASDYPPPPPETPGDELKKYAHMIKGVAANLGLYELSEAAALSERDISDPEKYADFAANMVAMCEKIKLNVVAGEETGPGKTTGKKGGKEEYDRLIAKLRLAAEQFNPSECEKIMEKLRSVEWKGGPLPEIAAISKAIDNYDFDGVRKILDKP